MSSTRSPGRLISVLLTQVHCPICTTPGPKQRSHAPRRTRPVRCIACGFKFTLVLNDVIAALPEDTDARAIEAFQHAVAGRQPSLTVAEARGMLADIERQIEIQAREVLQIHAAASDVARPLTPAERARMKRLQRQAALIPEAERDRLERARLAELDHDAKMIQYGREADARTAEHYARESRERRERWEGSRDADAGKPVPEDVDSYEDDEAEIARDIAGIENETCAEAQARARACLCLPRAVMRLQSSRTHQGRRRNLPA